MTLDPFSHTIAPAVSSDNDAWDCFCDLSTGKGSQAAEDFLKLWAMRTTLRVGDTRFVKEMEHWLSIWGFNCARTSPHNLTRPR